MSAKRYKVKNFEVLLNQLNNQLSKVEEKAQLQAGKKEKYIRHLSAIRSQFYELENQIKDLKNSIGKEYIMLLKKIDRSYNKLKHDVTGISFKLKDNKKRLRWGGFEDSEWNYYFYLN